VVSVTLMDIRERSTHNPYPVDLLSGCRSALVLFAAGFHGAQDGIFLADAGLEATCVDENPDRLHEMAAVYPASWEFVVADAFEFAEACDERYDIVSVDCPTSLFDRCAEETPLWCSLARVAVVLGTGARTSPPVVPDGWEMTWQIRRSSFAGGVFWTVLETT
jgi:hypothetical protein